MQALDRHILHVAPVDGAAQRRGLGLAGGPWYVVDKDIDRNLIEVAHADELETSLYLHLAPERVRQDRMRAGNDVMGEYLSSDSTSNYPVRFNDYWGRWTEIGVHGDPTAANAEKGAVILEAAVSKLIAIVDEWRAWPIAERADQHAHPVQSQIRW